MSQSEDNQAQIIALQNDQFRNYPINVFGIAGQVVLTRGIADLGEVDLQAIMSRVQDFDEFTEGDDPYGWHNFGAFTYKGLKIFWKIDLYDVNYEMGSPEPENPEVTRRVLTIMLAEEY